MKITPLSSGSGDPGTILGNIEVGSAPANKREAALRAFKGESPVSMRESETPVDYQVQRLQKKRTLTMKTNATPGYVPQEQELNDTPPATLEHNEQEASEVTKPLSPQFAALAKQKRALQVKERELLEREKALSAEPQRTGIDISRLKSDPLGVLQEAGVSYDDLTNVLLNGKPQNFEVQSMIQSLKDENNSLRETIDQKFTERDTQAEQQVLREITREAEYLASQSEQFKGVKATKSVPDVVDLIHRTWKESGEILDTTEALKLVEEQLREELAPIARELGYQDPQKFGELRPTRQPQMRTLTNRDGSSSHLTPKQRAIMAFEGKLKRG